MKWSAIRALAVGAALVAVHDGAAAREATRTANLKPNRVDIEYVVPKSANYNALHKLLKERRALEKIRDLLTPLRLPHRVLLQTRDCDGMSNALSNEDGVIVCYEFLDEIWKNVPDTITPAGVAPIDALIGPFMDVFLHEAGHLVFSALKIPLFGREEDAADQFSTYIMLRFEKEEARRLILGSAYQYKGDMSSPTVTITLQKFADEHGTSAQRFYNLLCMAYGADPKLFADLVEKKILPENRAIDCEREYAQASHAFNTLLGPHIDRRLARKLHKRWLPPVEARPRPWRGSPPRR